MLDTIKMCLENWGERAPMCVMAFDDNDLEDPDEYLVDSGEDMLNAVKDIVKNRRPDAKTEIVIDYMTGSRIPVKTSVTMTLQTLKYFRYKPDGITFLALEESSPGESEEYLAEVFANADTVLMVSIVTTLLFLMRETD